MTPVIRKHLVHIGFLVLLQAVLLFFTSGNFKWEAAWAYLPVVFLIIKIFVRTALEDRTLQNELEGHQGYAGQVRYRSIPGVW